MNIYVAIACLLASANADGSLGLGGLGGPGGLVYAPGHASPDYYAYPRYAFEYAVKDPHTGDNKAQWEKREGDVVKGAYSLVEPDGNLRIVEYWADDKSGFNAVVKRVGPSVHPTIVHQPPIYKAPIPVLSQGPVLSPISVGPVAQLGHLANAPYISGPAHGPYRAISTQSLIKTPLPVVKNLIPVPVYAPLPLPAPILKPVLAEPLYRPGPLYTRPLGPPISYKAPLPIYNPLPVYKEALPINVNPYNLGIISQGRVPIGSLEAGPIRPWGPIGPLGPIDLGGYGLVKGAIGPVGPLPLGPGYDYAGKGPLLPAWEGPLGYSQPDYKH